MLQRNIFWRSPRLRYTLAVGLLIAGFLLLMWRGDFFMAARLRLNDIYIVAAPTSNNIVIVAIDDASLNRYGRTPAEWSRSVHVEYINKLAETNARVVAIDLLFSEPEPSDVALAEAFDHLRESGTRIVLGSAGVNTVVGTDNDAFHELAFVTDLPISPIIAESVQYRGYVNTLPDIDSVIRRQPSLIQLSDGIAYSFSLATYLAYLRIPATLAEQVISTQDDNLLVTSDRQLPVDQYGLWQPYYFGPPASQSSMTFPSLSLIDLVDGNFSADLFDDKIVLVGMMNNTGMLDMYQVPSSSSGNLMAGIEIQANAIESIIQNIFLTSLPDGWYAFVIIFLSMTSSLIYATVRWYFKVVLAIFLIIMWLVLTSIVFSTHYITINLLDTLLALSLPVVASVGIDITLETVRRQQKEFLLSSLNRLAAQRLKLVQAADYILQDAEKIAPNSSATLYIRSSQNTDEYQRFKRGEKLETGLVTKEDFLLLKYQFAKVLVRDSGVTSIPLSWHGFWLGMIVLEHPFQVHLNHTAEQFLQELAGQLAPNIDNMLLYEEVERQKSLLDSVFAESPAGIAIVDANGIIIQCNQDLADLFDLPLEALKGEPFPYLLGAKAGDNKLTAKLLSGIKSKIEFNVDEVTLGDISVRVGGAPLHSYDLWTIIVGDVTALVDLSKLKTQLLRIASHDLKNPLARILGFGELLKMTATLESEQEQYLQYILKGADEMLNIINDILSLERLRSGKVISEDINFTQLVREVCESHQPDTIQKRQNFNLQLPDDRIVIHADAGQLSQAVTNLIGNAIKYTPDMGTINVCLQEKDNKIRFEVEDTGYGIPQKAQDKLFTEFYRVKSQATSHISGTGLGLSLVKSVIDALGGEIGFTSTEGVGSMFYFVLPGTISDDTSQDN